MRRIRASFAAAPAVLLALIAAFQSSDTRAQTRLQRLGKDRPQVMERWRQTLEESNRLLAAGEWKRARKAADRLLTEMSGRIESGEAAAVLLAAAAAQRAVAQAGLGNERDASWDWEMAVALNPDFAELALDDYGEGGARLDRIRAAPDDWDDQLPPGAPVQPPRKLRSTPPRYPYAKKVACLENAIVIETIIDRDGMLQRPRPASTNDPVLSFAAMDALRDWRFQPARVNGRPIAVVYNLTVNFRLRLCQNPLAIRERARDQ